MSSSLSTAGRSVLLPVLGLLARHTGAVCGVRASFGSGVSCLPQLSCAHGLTLTRSGKGALGCLGTTLITSAPLECVCVLLPESPGKLLPMLSQEVVSRWQVNTWLSRQLLSFSR